MAKVFKILCAIAIVTYPESAAVHADELKRDPTLPLEHQKGGESIKQKVTLQAIFSRYGEAKKAIVNGVLLAEGESVDGWTLNEIRTGHVLLHSGIETKTLYLRSSVTQ